MDFDTLFPDLKDLQLKSLIHQYGLKRVIEEGEVLMQPGDQIQYVPLILDGSVRVMREDSEGRELFLYYLHEGDTCAISLNCCMASGQSEILAVAETQVTIMMIPVKFLDQWMNEFVCWRNFILSTYRTRFEELLSTLDSVAFQKMDHRILQYLREKSIAQNSNILEGTHQKIANEIHSTREVVSRVLKQLERRRFLRLGRNKIELTI
mgnify:FL=1